MLLRLVVIIDDRQAARAVDTQRGVAEIRVRRAGRREDIDAPWQQPRAAGNFQQVGPHAGVRAAVLPRRDEQRQQAVLERVIDDLRPCVRGGAGACGVEQGQVEDLPHHVPSRRFDHEQASDEQRQGGRGELHHRGAVLARRISRDGARLRGKGNTEKHGASVRRAPACVHYGNYA